MKKPISLSVFFPAYNEEDNIAQAVEQAIHYIKGEPRIDEYEIIIVNDGSSDGTREIADRLASTYTEVRTIHHSPNQGYGAALIGGITTAQYEYIFFTDADLQFDIQELSKLLEFVPEYSFVSGYRAVRKDPFMRLANAYGWKMLNRSLFGLHTKDIDCAFKLFRRDLVQPLPIVSRGAMISAEILIRVMRKGVDVKEVAVTHLPRTAGSPTGAKPSVIARALKEMFHLYTGDLKNPTHQQLLKYCTVGVLNTLVDISIYIILTRLVYLDSITFAKFLSFLAGTISSFALNRSWTFSVRGNVRAPEIVRFYSSVTISLIVNLAIMGFLTHILHMYDLVALLITTVITFALGFTISRAWVFITYSQERLASSPFIK